MSAADIFIERVRDLLVECKADACDDHQAIAETIYGMVGVPLDRILKSGDVVMEILVVRNGQNVAIDHQDGDLPLWVQP